MDRQELMREKPFEIVRLEQGTAVWRAWRHQGIGASDAPAIMGENPYQSLEALLREKMGEVRRGGASEAMARGNALEPIARDLYNSRMGVGVQPICLQSTRFEWLRASLDGLSEQHDVVVEIKCGHAAYRIARDSGAVPKYYVGQLQHILAVTGLASIDFWCYSPELEPILIPVPRDEAYIARMLALELAFWERVRSMG
jgi:putative phage-type endonuclease